MKSFVNVSLVTYRVVRPLRVVADVRADRLQEMGLAEPRAAVDEERVVGLCRRLGDGQRRRVREAVRRADHEVVERVLRVGAGLAVAPGDRDRGAAGASTSPVAASTSSVTASRVRACRGPRSGAGRGSCSRSRSARTRSGRRARTCRPGAPAVEPRRTTSRRSTRSACPGAVGRRRPRGVLRSARRGSPRAARCSFGGRKSGEHTTVRSSASERSDGPRRDAERDPICRYFYTSPHESPQLWTTVRAAPARATLAPP